jgi:hypothetical protein
VLKAYVNYPNSHVTIHRHGDCSSIQQQRKPEQRVVRLETSTLSSELKKFEQKQYTFAADASRNDLWLEVDFGDLEFERAVVAYVKKILASHYTPFARASIDTHC